MHHQTTLSRQTLVAGLASLLGLGILLAMVQVGLVAAPYAEPTTDPAPTGVRRVIYANEWGVARPAGLIYSAKLGQFFVVDKRRPQKEEKATLVAITPHDALQDYKQLTFAIDDAINVAYDDATGRFLALNQKRGELIQITLDSTGRPQAGTVERASIAALGLRNPQGMAVDTVGQRLFVLDSGAQQIMSLDLTTPFPYSNGVSTIPLASFGVQSWRGLAHHPVSRQLFVAAPAQQMLYAISQKGALAKAYTLADLALSDPQSFVFAPSADLTDAPDTWHLFIADSYLSGSLAAGVDPAALTQRSYLPLVAAQEGGTAIASEESETAQTDKKKYLGNIVEVALDWSAGDVTAAAADATIVLTLVQTVNTSAFSPPSPDPSGLVYIPSLNRLFISDGEVDEMPALFTGANLFETSLSGGLIRTGSTLGYSNEPTGVAYNPANGHLFIADDDRRDIYELTAGADGLFGTGDDSRTFFDTAIFNSLDPEGLTYDTATGALFIADGINNEVYRVSPGANGHFDGVPPTGDDQVTNFDVQALNIFDPEGIYYDAVSTHLFMVGNNRTRIYEITTAGVLVQLYDTSAAGIIKNADITLAPGSNNPAVTNFYIVDRVIDNDVDPSENDGKLFELSRPVINPTPTNTPVPPTPTDTLVPPTPTPTNTPVPPTPTNTPVPPTPTPTNTPIPPTPTNTPTRTNTPVPAVCPSGAFYLDQFGAVSYNNNNGNRTWSGSWVETVDNNSPNSGRIRISNGELRISDSPDSGQQPTIRRIANLSGATSATLSFSHRTPNTVDPNDEVTVQISNNGGTSWTTLQTIAGQTSSTKSYNINAFISANTAVRFVVSLNYNINDEYFAIDNLRISCN